MEGKWKRIYKGWWCLPEDTGEKRDDPMMFMLPPEEENPSMYVLSNGDKLNGAAAILDGKTMEDISEKLGG